jgi:hypothetical protein
MRWLRQAVLTRIEAIVSVRRTTLFMLATAQRSTSGRAMQQGAPSCKSPDCVQMM